MHNRAAVLVEPQKIEIREIPMPTLDGDGGDDVIIRMKYVGICGSDAHFFEKGRIGTNVAPLPYILGHETAGVVESAGCRVTHLKAGDEVTIEPGIPCGQCGFCLGGRYNLCRHVRFLSSPPHNGALREYIRYPARWTYAVPKNVASATAALVEPLAVGIHAVNRSGLWVGDSVAILGCGCIGLMTLLAAKARGASRIIVTDIFAKRLGMARALGATDAIDDGGEDGMRRILELTNEEGADVVFEAAGHPATVAQAPYLVKRGGLIVLVGNTVPDVPFSFRQLYLKEADVKTVFRYRNLYPQALHELGSGRIKLDGLAVDIFSFAESQDAFERAVTDKSNVVKVVIQF